MALRTSHSALLRDRSGMPGEHSVPWEVQCVTIDSVSAISREIHLLIVLIVISSFMNRMILFLVVWGLEPRVSRRKASTPPPRHVLTLGVILVESWFLCGLVFSPGGAEEGEEQKVTRWLRVRSGAS